MVTSYRRVFTCKITMKNRSVVWLDLGFQMEGWGESESGEVIGGTPVRSCLLDMKGSDWAKIDLYEYGGNQPSLKEAKGDYVCTQTA